MKKYYFLVLLLLFTIACAYKNVEIIELRKIADEINDRILKVKYDNFSSIEINDEAKVIIVKLVDDSIKEQIWFKENISDSKYILFKKGKFSNINNNIEYELSRKEKNIVKGYHQYFVNNDRIVYLSNDIDEIYYLNKESNL